MTTKRARMFAAIAYLVVDLVVIGLFITAGRETRRTDVGGFVLEALPFVTGALLGWAVARGWRAPRGFIPTALAVWLSTSLGGLAIRVAVGEPTDTRFMFITTIALGAFLFGWRALAWAIDAVFGPGVPRVVDEKYRK
ncbi:DUF3054 domain-containing protein [Marisediminicola sp. LYQ85]|uniref:DUF3054 domain-containing protein n=1 Tax=Marisediminicola sp. LYQ85 TaxID=3391062 RepID=UPI003983852A